MTASPDLIRILAPLASIDGGALRITNESALASAQMDQLVRVAVFGTESDRH